MSVCNGQLWRPEESTDFDETRLVGSYQDLVVCFWAPLLWTPTLPINGTLKLFEKNPKFFFFRKSKIGFRAFMRTVINLFVKKFQPHPSKTVWLVCNYITICFHPNIRVGIPSRRVRESNTNDEWTVARHVSIWNNERQKCHLKCSLIYIFQIRLSRATTHVAYRLVNAVVCLPTVRRSVDMNAE